jgi:hypothetical protein
MNKVISFFRKLFLKYFYKYIHKYIHEIENSIFLTYFFIDYQTILIENDNVAHLRYLALGNVREIVVNNFKNEILHLPPWCKICNFSGNNYPSNLSIISDNLIQIVNYPNVTCDNLPKSLREISFRDIFNKKIDNLPHELEIIEFSNSPFGFSQQLANLPPNTHTILNYPNVSCDLLPTNLKKILFVYDFNQNIDNLSLNLKEIRFGRCFKRPINNLPQSVEKITLGYDSLMITTKLPHNLKHLYVLISPSNFNQKSIKIKQHVFNIFDDCQTTEDNGQILIFTKN